MTKRIHTFLIFSAPQFISILVLFLDASVGNPTTRVLDFRCDNDFVKQSSFYVQGFVAALEKISSQIQTSGFGVAVIGSGPESIFCLAQCHHNLSSTDCLLCYAEARTIIPQCYPLKGMQVFLNGCFLRIDNYSFFQEYARPGDKTVCGNRTRNSTMFRHAVVQAVSVSNVTMDYVKSPTSRGTNESAYVLSDCWKTLSANSCRACLENASASVLGCLPTSEGHALRSGCFMRYSDTNFLDVQSGNGSSRENGSSGVNQRENGTSSGDQRGKSYTVIVGVTLGVGLSAAAAIGVYIWKCRKLPKNGRGANGKDKLAEGLHDFNLIFKYSVLKKATCSFDDANMLGQGGFGTVYKGTLPDGKEIAVKRLFLNKKHKAADFYNEVNIISSIRHKNLVRLLGCSCTGPESLLVYELLPNGSLDHLIFDPEKGKTLEWEKRLEIIIGTAEGLVYLHENTETRIVHRDIKASNILLDSRLRAKIADFGLARSFQQDKSHISTGIAGTLGYMAPEYVGHGQLTEKVDVYSFGVLLLEIVTGRPNNSRKTLEPSDSLVTTVWKHFQQDNVQELFDTNLELQNNYDIKIEQEILRVVHVGLLCTQKIPSFRPTMSSALQMLLREDEHRPTPTHPPFMDDELGVEPGNEQENQTYSPNVRAPASNASVSYSSLHPR
ncbi:hypothetical protein ACH5RR_030715 [Cinchona calisaya]|uniref:Cysteine-rich receptor-like protein kinase 2 n=1 Tax=Cinchona calisaya TaxID=153742 RepID=A0ABD2YYA5_9GENT